MYYCFSGWTFVLTLSLFQTFALQALPEVLFFSLSFLYSLFFFFFLFFHKERNIDFSLKLTGSLPELRIVVRIFGGTRTLNFRVFFFFYHNKINKVGWVKLVFIVKINPWLNDTLFNAQPNLSSLFSGFTSFFTQNLRRLLSFDFGSICVTSHRCRNKVRLITKNICFGLLLLYNVSLLF